ncbi:hypothetical protein LRM36_04305 [Stenotrophomonas maltophilia]|uniref:hypothetical protein n=1 Tax=Stenotrophomonas pavanii TaxID=487698 RepID=UPI0023276187|nr:hypothetical protein [Stenotrophomonas maltophilia]
MKVVPLVAAAITCLSLTACREPNAPIPAAAREAAPSPTEPEAAPASQGGSGAAVSELDAQKPRAAGTCNLESSNNILFASDVAPAKSGQTLRGWLGHDAAATPAEPRILLRNTAGASVAAVDIALAQQRDDVVQSNGGREDLRHSGFEVAIPALEPGIYAMVLRYTVDGEAYSCDNGRRIQID